MSVDPTALALAMAEKMMLAVSRDERTLDRLQETAETAGRAASAIGEVDLPQLVAELKARFVVWVPREVTVSDPRKHQPWYSEHREKISFDYWRRYETWLSEKAGWRPQTVEALHETTERVLDLLENPARPGPWDVHGLVYGQVQSGKTANYTGTICKAVDAGYQVIIVLTGVHESLRTQTQTRLDMEFLGFNSKVTRTPAEGGGLGQIGVGALGLTPPSVPCFSLTSTEQDFTTRVFESSSVDLRRVRLLVVAKKHKSILENLATWLDNFCEQQGDGRRIIADAPLLLIDDEADNASIDTRKAKNGSHSDPDHDPTAINRAVRNLLRLFDKSVYLGYTATPFGNIFIPHDTDHPEYGPDLFPASFILALRPPSNYCGPEMVFGLEDPTSAEVRQPLPIIRVVDDQEPWIHNGHKKGHRPASRLPGSLVEAIDAFILSTAVRQVRAQRPGGRLGHSSMLIHVTRWTDTQGAVVKQVRHHLAHMQDTWGDRGTAGTALRRRLSKLWREDFERTQATLTARDDIGDSVGDPVTLNQVLERIPDVLAETAAGVKAINGTAEDVLDYRSSAPATVVAVGGDKLSRGLTLEGLTVSYYLRASSTYDTLLQMGRWFGYRPGYLDVTRLYTTQELVDYYVHITRANRDLMDVVSAVAEQGLTPVDVGLRVIDGYGRLQVTASAKMRASKQVTFTFSGVRAETLVMKTDDGSTTTNNRQLHEIVQAIVDYPEVPRESRKSSQGIFRQDVPPEIVTTFLNGFEASSSNEQATPDLLVEYIEAQKRKGELVRWTVAIVAGSSKKTDLLAGVKLPRVLRNKYSGTSAPGESHKVGVLVNPMDEAIGLTTDQYDMAQRATEADFRSRADPRTPKRPSGTALRRRRDPAEGLLVIYRVDPGTGADDDPPIVGYSLSFPTSERAQHLKYRANQKFIEKLVASAHADEVGEPEENQE
ncbi:Z1 domain-containing protein [Longispora sp. K20-0274]|uniref:Z1 domain-containing protein n=1 Tax=Longispora sp. K20-0274 TaxID=3088255 RepID=UPI00399AB9E5